MSRARDIADFGLVSNRLDTVGGSSGALSNRNLFQNGACLISQRGTSFPDANGMTLDRFKVTRNGATRNVVTQENDGPTGFSKSLKVSPSTADTSLTGSDLSFIIINLEGQDLQQLAYGTSGAKDLTMSFYAKSNLTGNITVSNEVNLGPPFSSRYFTISSANTWERHTLTWTGNPDTAIDNDNTTGIEFQMILAAGPNFSSGTYNEGWHTTGGDRVRSDNINLSSSTSNYFQITGLQIEVGDTATPFEHRSFGDQLKACQRYFAKSYPYSTAIGATTGKAMVQTDFHENNQGAGYREKYDFQFPVEMRASPTITQYDSAGTSGKANYYITVSSTANHTVSIGNLNARCLGGYSDRSTTIGGWAFHYTADAEL